MARHPRTIWKPVRILHNINDTTAPPVAFFTAVRDVDADASQGLQLRRVETMLTMGITGTAGTNVDFATGISGYFKWPSDAATPTISTIDLDNRTKIFDRRPWAVQGLTPRIFKNRAKSVRLTLGETLFFYLLKAAESSTDILLVTGGRTDHWETQA